MTHPDQVVENRALLDKLIAGEIPSYVIEKRIYRKSGELIWVRASAIADRRDGEGRAGQLVGLVERTSDARKKAESTVSSKARLAELGSEIGRAITQTDLLREALQHCAQAVVEHLDAAFARVWIFDAAENALDPCGERRHVYPSGWRSIRGFQSDF